MDRRHEGIRIALAMSPSLLSEVVQNDGEVVFNALTDEDLELELDIVAVGESDPDEPDDEFVRMEFETAPEEYVPGEYDPDEDRG